MECMKHDSLLVRKQTSNGATLYTYQCQTCGQIDYAKTGRGPWVAKPATVDLEALPEWDEEIQRTAVESVRLQAEAQRAERDEQWWSEYHAYLDSYAWREKRVRVLNRDGHLCQGCLEAVATDIHHMTYDRLFNELLCDLVSLCPACHQLCHPHKDILGRELHGRSVSVH